MKTKYEVTIKRTCSANNSQIREIVEIKSSIRIPSNKSDKEEFFKSQVMVQYPNISKPCKDGEFKVVAIIKK